ncbi:MAG: acyltransferase family protein [Bacteroidales bacterium]|nr:acyltransferase family protein [Candidatus Physcousia equi]
MNTKETFQRLYWLDWMKTIGIGLIVYVHFFSLYDIYACVFNVPLFFLISGFLCKKEPDTCTFWKKLWYNLMLPMVMMCTVNYLWAAFKWYCFSSGYAEPENPLLFYGKVLIGLQWTIETLWFVYTLMILKIIFQYTRSDYFHVVWFLLFLSFAYVINNYDIEIMGMHPFKIPWSITNSFVSYPFFIIGYFMQKWKDKLSCYQANKYTFCWIIITLFLIFICGHNHEYVSLYLCGYGDNMILFLVGGLAGSAFVFFLSKLLEGFRWSIVTDISVGTILILGLHVHFISFIRRFFVDPSIADLFFTIIIVLLFVPIIRFCKSYIPIILGKYRLK